MMRSRFFYVGFLILLASKSGRAQTYLDNYLLFNLGLLEPNTVMKHQKVKSVFADYLDSNQTVIFIEEKEFDTVGRIIRWARYNGETRKDSLVGYFAWNRDTVDVAVAISSFDRSKIPSDYDSRYMTRELTLAKKSVTRRKFWREGDTTVAICDKDTGCNRAIRIFYIYGGPTDFFAYTYLDSKKINLSDTTIQESRNGDIINYSIVRDYFIDFGRLKVKHAFMRFRADTLVAMEVQESTFDSIGRQISYKDFLGIEQTADLCVNTIYDDKNFTTRVERDYYPVTGQPDFVWTYNKYGNIMKSESYSELYNSHVVTDILYVHPGIVSKVETRRGGILISKKIYHYNYYR